MTTHEEIPAAALADLAIFPLPRMVLFPRATMRLHIFEPRYRAMLQACMAGHKAMALALVVEPASLDEAGNPRIAPICGIGVVVEHQPLPDGRSNILLHGRGRVQLKEIADPGTPYRRARATMLREIPSEVDDIDRASLMASATAFASEVARRNDRFSLQVPAGLEPGPMSDLCAHHLIVDARARQAILEELDVRERVRMVTQQLVAQHGALAREGGRGRN